MSSSSNNEKYSELYIEAKRLSRKIVLLKRWSIVLLIIRLQRLFILPIHVFLLNYFINVNETIDKPTIIHVFCVLWFFFFLLSFLIGIIGRKLYPLYNDTQRDWNRLSDKVDWTEMRKKQLYSTLDKRIQKPIDNFSKFRRSILNPFFDYDNRRTKNIFWYVVNLLCSLELYASPVITLILLF